MMARKVHNKSTSRALTATKKHSRVAHQIKSLNLNVTASFREFFLRHPTRLIIIPFLVAVLVSALAVVTIIFTQSDSTTELKLDGSPRELNITLIKEIQSQLEIRQRAYDNPPDFPSDAFSRTTP